MLHQHQLLKLQLLQLLTQLPLLLLLLRPLRLLLTLLLPLRLLHRPQLRLLHRLLSNFQHGLKRKPTFGSAFFRLLFCKLRGRWIAGVIGGVCWKAGFALFQTTMRSGRGSKVV